MPAFTYDANLIRVIDADLLDFSVELGFRINVVQRVKLLGVICPERHTLEGQIARQFVIDFFNLGKKCVISTHKTETPDCYLATVRYRAVNLNKLLIKEGLARLHYVERTETRGRKRKINAETAI